MPSKEDVILQRNINIGCRLNLIIGDASDLTPLNNYRSDIRNRKFYGLVLVHFSPDEEKVISRTINAACRADIDTVGKLRIKTIEELTQINGISRASAHFLDEAFKHPTLT